VGLLILEVVCQLLLPKEENLKVRRLQYRIYDQVGRVQDLMQQYLKHRQ
jgi:hypothetical protein